MKLIIFQAFFLFVNLELIVRVGSVQTDDSCPPCNCETSTRMTTTRYITSSPKKSTTTKNSCTSSEGTTVIDSTTLAPIFTNSSELECIFPFYYNGTWYDKCIASDDSQAYWCSLDKTFKNRRAPCEQPCPLLARNIVADNPSDIHSACLDTRSDAIPLFPNINQTNLILDYHNDLRSKVEPPASNMRTLIWDFGLARLAQRWAENCVFSHDCNNCRTLLNNQSIYVGQNAYATFGGQYDPEQFWIDVIDLWNSEASNFQYGVGSVTGNFNDVGHYSQLISADAVKIGCGAAQCSDGTYAYCNYAVGQSSFETPYEQGPSCSKCSLENCKNNLCLCSKLCQNNGFLDPVNCKCSCYEGYFGEECENLTII